MRIELKKFGKILSSRPDGKEAFLAIRPTLNLNADVVEIDFSGITALGPSWADEFLTALKEVYGNKVKYLRSDNPSVVETLEILK